MNRTLASTLTFCGFLAVTAASSSCTRTGQAQMETDRLVIMSFNILHGGTRRGQPLSQTAAVMQVASPDVVGLQEAGGSAEKLAQLLGWDLDRQGGSPAILTRHKIVERYKGGVRIELDSGRQIRVFNLHLRPAPYQPYQLLRIRNAPFITTEWEAVDAANRARGGSVAALLEKIGALPDQDMPVFVTGDFNEPSHLDWTDNAASKGLHPIKVAYPASQAMTAAGFSDAWRAVYPDEIDRGGLTWTPVTQPDDPKDHHDRIDYVYFRGKSVEVVDAKIIGENEENADLVVSPYPSDHRAVVATFAIPIGSRLVKAGLK